MKKINLVYSTLLVVLISLFGCRPSPEDAGVYNEKVVLIQEELALKVKNLNDQFNTFDNEKIKKAMEELKTELDKSEKSAAKLTAFDDKTELKDSLIAYINATKAVFEKEYTEMANIYKLPEESWDKELEDKFNTFKNSAVGIYTGAFENLKTAENEFAEKYNIKLVNIKEIEK